MVVCQFYLRGTCKFGNNCYNEHQDPSSFKNFGETHQSVSILRQTNFNAPQPSKTTTAVDINVLVKTVIADMTGAEKGGQWFLSCYAPFTEKAAFPGFDDISPEEIRWGYYEAQKNGTVDQYKQQLQVLLQNMLMKIRALQNPDQEVINTLQCFYNTPPSSNSGIFAQNSNVNVPQQNTNMFASQNNQTSNNVFGIQQNNSSVFGGTTSTNIFANQQPQVQTNIFSNSANMFDQNPSNFFHTSAKTNNIFGNTNQMDSSQSSGGSIFGNSQQTTVLAGTQANMFGQNNTSGFDQGNLPLNQQQQNIQTNIFASQNVQTNVPNQSMLNISHNQNVFNRNTQENASAPIFGHPNKHVQESVDMTLYTKAENLTDEEKHWFESDNLDLMNIPNKPPTYEMCFKAL